MLLDSGRKSEYQEENPHTQTVIWAQDENIYTTNKKKPIPVSATPTLGLNLTIDKNIWRTKQIIQIQIMALHYTPTESVTGLSRGQRSMCPIPYSDRILISVKCYKIFVCFSQLLFLQTQMLVSHWYVHMSAFEIYYKTAIFLWWCM